MKQRKYSGAEGPDEKTLLWVLLRIGVCLTAVALMVGMVENILVHTRKIRQDVKTLVSYTQETVHSLMAEPEKVHSQPAPAADTLAPEILGVKPIFCYVGEPVTYRAGVCIQDNADPVPELEVDTTLVDLTTPGTYPVTYRAWDSAGNVATAETTVRVREKKEGFVPMAEIESLADDLLSGFVTPDMDQEQQVWAIYNWLRSHCRYENHTVKDDPMQAAYRMLTQGAGDCYYYFSASKLFFDRLGIENVDVQKQKKTAEDSDHYWSMVSLDGGESWYHFDCTPRLGQVKDFCLVTDAQLDEYSEAHGNCHRRDRSLYPDTPEAPYGTR